MKPKRPPSPPPYPSLSPSQTPSQTPSQILRLPSRPTAPPLIPGFNPETVEAPVPAKPTEPTIPQLPTPNRNQPGHHSRAGDNPPGRWVGVRPEAPPRSAGLARKQMPKGACFAANSSKVSAKGKACSAMQQGSLIARVSGKGLSVHWHSVFYYAATDQVKLRGEYLQGRMIDGKNFDRAGRSY